VNVRRADIYNFLTADMDYRIYCFSDFLFNRGSMEFSEFFKCGLYPFRAFNFVALPAEKQGAIQATGMPRVLDYRGFRKSDVLLPGDKFGLRPAASSKQSRRG
jgi:hypothetical protein